MVESEWKWIGEMMDAKDFAVFVTQGQFNFSLCPRETVVAKLREIADRIEANERPRIVLQNAYSCDEATRDDYLLTILTLQFAELSPEAKPGAKLWGGSSLFPVEEVEGIES
jgi:hypothetical protein